MENQDEFYSTSEEFVIPPGAPQLMEFIGTFEGVEAESRVSNSGSDYRIAVVTWVDVKVIRAVTPLTEDYYSWEVFPSQWKGSEFAEFKLSLGGVAGAEDLRDAYGKRLRMKARHIGEDRRGYNRWTFDVAEVVGEGNPRPVEGGADATMAAMELMLGRTPEEFRQAAVIDGRIGQDNELLGRILSGAFAKEVEKQSGVLLGTAGRYIMSDEVPY